MQITPTFFSCFLYISFVAVFFLTVVPHKEQCYRSRTGMGSDRSSYRIDQKAFISELFSAFTASPKATVSVPSL